MSIEIREVTSKADLKKFVKLPWSLFKDDPNWVPPLIMERMDVLSKGKNPYFDHAEVRLWMAYRDGQAVGRITAQIDSLVREYHKENTGHFGFFDCINDQSVANALLDTALGWLKEKGMDEVIGPFNLSINEETGLLVDGFNTPPSLMMGHALPYFEDLLVGYGLCKIKDVWAYDMKITEEFLPPGIQKLVNKTFAGDTVTIRPIDMKHYERDLKILLDIHEDAWSENWKNLPFTEAELDQTVKDMKLLIREDFTYIAEVDGEPQAMMVTLPNLNEVITDLDGKLFPFGFLKLLWRLKIRPRYKTVRVPLMGVRKKYQNTRLGGAMAFGLIETCRISAAAAGCTHAELSWVLEENTRLSKMLETIGCRKYKTYRLFSKAL